MMNMMPGMPGSMPQQPQAAGGGMSLPQLLAMIQQSQGSGSGGMPMAAPSGATPMAGYIGAPGGQGMMHPAMAPVAGPQAAPGLGGVLGQGTPGQAAGQGNSLMALLAQLRGGQTGVPPGPPGTPMPNQPGNTQSALTMGPNGMWQGTPGQPQAVAGALPTGMAGQMTPAQQQYLMSLFHGAQIPPQPTPVQG